MRLKLRNLDNGQIVLAFLLLVIASFAGTTLGFLYVHNLNNQRIKDLCTFSRATRDPLAIYIHSEVKLTIEARKLGLLKSGNPKLAKLQIQSEKNLSILDNEFQNTPTPACSVAHGDHPKG